MGLLEQEIKELRQMNTMLMAGEIKPAEVNARIGIYSQIEKRAKMLLQAYALGAKFGASNLKKLQNTQFLGQAGTIIDTGTDVSQENIFCPDQEKVIIRMECKQFSGATGNLTNCSSCPNFKITRRLLNNIEGQ